MSLVEDDIGILIYIWKILEIVLILYMLCMSVMFVCLCFVWGKVVRED